MEIAVIADIHGNDVALERCMELCGEAEGECIWPHIPGKYWQHAVEEMIKC